MNEILNNKYDSSTQFLEFDTNIKQVELLADSLNH